MRVVVVLVLLASARAAAAPDTPPPPCAPPAPSPPGMVAPLPLPPADAAPTSDKVPNVPAQVLVGGALGVAGLYLGGVAGYKLECAGGCRGDFGGLGGALLGAAIGLTTGSTVGVVLMGQDRDHDASTSLTVLGSIVGGSLTLLASGQILDEHPLPALALLGTGTALGGALMYRLTWTRRRPSTPTTAIHLVPYTTGTSIGLSLIGNTP